MEKSALAFNFRRLGALLSTTVGSIMPAKKYLLNFALLATLPLHQNLS
jgi:hypothetical protein